MKNYKLNKTPKFLSITALLFLFGLLFYACVDQPIIDSPSEQLVLNKTQLEAEFEELISDIAPYKNNFDERDIPAQLKDKYESYLNLYRTHSACEYDMEGADEGCLDPIYVVDSVMTVDISGYGTNTCNVYVSYTLIICPDYGIQIRDFEYHINTNSSLPNYCGNLLFLIADDPQIHYGGWMGDHHNYLRSKVISNILTQLENQIITDYAAGHDNYFLFIQTPINWFCYQSCDSDPYEKCGEGCCTRLRMFYEYGEGVVDFDAQVQGTACIELPTNQPDECSEPSDVCNNLNAEVISGTPEANCSQIDNMN